MREPDEAARKHLCASVSGASSAKWIRTTSFPSRNESLLLLVNAPRLLRLMPFYLTPRTDNFIPNIAVASFDFTSFLQRLHLIRFDLRRANTIRAYTSATRFLRSPALLGNTPFDIHAFKIN
jgi:hypothetical protein